MPISEILYASGRRLLGEKVNNIEELVEKMQASANFTPRDVADAKQFYKTLIELYNENLSSAMEITKNVTDFDVATRMFSAEGTVDLFHTEELNGRPIFEDVELPPIALLKSLKFDFVLACRGSNEFKEYCDALQLWTKNSRDFVCRDNVTQAVKAYVKKIHTLCHHDHRYFDEYRVTVSHKPRSLRLGGQLLGLGTSGAGAFAVHEKLMEQTSDFAMAFASVLPEAGAAVAATIAAFAGGHVAAKVIESGAEATQHAGAHWLYISKGAGVAKRT